MKICAFVSCALLTLMTATAAPVRFYIGTYTGPTGGKGIYEGSLDDSGGKLGLAKLDAQIDNPSFLALSSDGNFLYCALEDWKDGSVAAFRRGVGGGLTLLNKMPAGAGTCFVSCAPVGRELFAANYNSGSIVAFYLGSDGAIGAVKSTITFMGSGPDKDRQQSPHAHSIYATGDGRWVYSCDLGSDKVWIFQRSPDGTLHPADPPSVSVPPGSGPRHLAFDSAGRFVYSSNEMRHSVDVFARKSSNGALELIQTMSALRADVPSKGVTTAEIALHPSGKWLYVSNRGSDTISVLEIVADGKIVLIQSVPALVKGPRNFAISPSGKWLLVAGQNDSRIAEFAIDPKTGQLGATGQSLSVGSPACIVFGKD